jgi:hypothetical protein
MSRRMMRWIPLSRQWLFSTLPDSELTALTTETETLAEPEEKKTKTKMTPIPTSFG